jgi:dihydrofolate synthase/folylpolyglutamate synthase
VTSASAAPVPPVAAGRATARAASYNVAMPRTLSDWLEYIERQHPQSIDLGLERVREVAARMGLQRPAPQVITVGGTNGKGSTVAFIEAIASAAGRRVGAYTSPHLLAYNERVRIDGADAGDADLVAAFEAVEAARGDTLLTYFEYGTLAALWLFERAGLDLAILEVGLGGRLDATNLVDPDVAVITTVDLDHQDWLGENRESIGFEKAGIARAWKPLVLGEDDPPASVLRHAYAIGASAIRAGCDFFFEPTDAAHWRWRELNFELALPRPSLAAPAQLRNAATAIAALRALGPDVPDEAVARGVARARASARLQGFERDGVEIVVDVGHNPQAGRELHGWLQASPVAGRTLAVFAALGDKDVAGVVNALGEGIDAWHLAGLLEGGPRGLAVDAFAERLAGTVAAAGARHADVAQALAAARAEARPGDRILVLGSFHTAAAALRMLQDASPRG